MTDDLQRLKPLKKALGQSLVEVSLGECWDEPESYALAKKNRLVGLNLDGIRRKTIPEEITGFKHLQCLSLTHRVAISNSRILKLTKDMVTFAYKKRRKDGPAENRTMTIPIAAFCLDISLAQDYIEANV